jgi:VanZ family protein
MLKYHRLWLAAGGLMVGMVVYLSLTPQPPVPLTFDNADKFEHVLAYASLSYWFCQLYTTGWARLAVITALIGLGVGLEYVQGWTGYRTFDVMDMLADGTGVFAGGLLACTPVGRMLAFIEHRTNI